MASSVLYSDKNLLRYYYGKRNGYGILLASEGWGAFSFFVEIDDQHVTRQVNRFDNGNVVRYDRSHWCDDFGFMFIGRFSRKLKAGRNLTPLSSEEFERTWTDALASSTWIEQVARSREKEWGSWAERVALT